MNDDWGRLPNERVAADPGTGDDDFTLTGPSVAAHVGGRSVCDLSEYGMVRVSGADAKAFLQGQCTVDMEELSGSVSRLGAFCNPKGRVLALALFIADTDDYLLRIPRANIDSTVATLGRYMLRSRVKLTEDTGIRGLGVVTGEAAGAIAPQLPESPYGTLDSDIGIMVRLPGEPCRVEIYGSEDQIADLRSRLPDSAQCDPERWRLLDIRAGVAEIYPASAELFVPQMLDLQRLGGVSFSKGCYTGQEIVARTQYLGRLKRRLVGARIAPGPRPLPGDTVFALEASGERDAVGRVVRAAADERGGCELLAVVRNAALEPQTPQLVTEHGQQLADIRSAV